MATKSAKTAEPDSNTISNNTTMATKSAKKTSEADTILKRIRSHIKYERMGIIG
jgi:hypothetical protein